jgi:hypothetical protein
MAGKSGNWNRQQSSSIVVEFNRFVEMTATMLPQFEQVNRKAAMDTSAMAKSLAPRDTGALANSISARQAGEGAWMVRVGVEYGAFVEYGTDHGTHVIAGQPYLTPAIAQIAPKWRQALKQIQPKGV